MYLPFKEAGLICEEMKAPWTPHSTIMKLSKGNPNKKPVRKIESESYEEHKEIKFGEQVFGSVELSCMGGVDPDGFYKCLHKQPFIISPSLSSSSSSSTPSSSSTTTATTTTN